MIRALTALEQAKRAKRPTASLEEHIATLAQDRLEVALALQYAVAVARVESFRPVRVAWDRALWAALARTDLTCPERFQLCQIVDDQIRRDEAALLREQELRRQRSQ
jgi:hypothetical protein